MRRTSIVPVVLLVLVICMVAVGFARGWFVVSSTQDAVTNKVDVNLTVDRDKMKADTRRAAEKTKAEADDLSAKAKQEVRDIKSNVKSKAD